jgi:type IV secretory pathway VirB4 component
MWWGAGGMRVRRHRATTAHLCSAYPFVAPAGQSTDGAYLGSDVLAGGAAFAWDPFDAYRAGTVTNPNALIAGEPGVGKSATTKCLLYRACGVFGRWAAIVDPKGEYRGLADALGMTVIELHPGGTARINPLEPGPAAADGPAETGRRQAIMLVALLGTVLRRDLTPAEDTALSAATTQLAHTGTRGQAPTLAELATLLADPTTEMAASARMAPLELTRRAETVRHALGKLLDRSLRGMFDGATTITPGSLAAGVVIDLSAVHHDPEALALVMVAATAWLQALFVQPGPARIQVLDEAWCLLGAERTSRYLQACWKLGRAHGVANLAVVHRLSDLRAQADDGTATAKVSMGLLADTQTRILFRQSSDQIGDARSLLGLTTTEANVLARLCRGRAIWKVGERTAVVQHHIGEAERAFCDTDARMVV